MKYKTLLYNRRKKIQIILKGKIYMHIYIYLYFSSIVHRLKRDCVSLWHFSQRGETDDLGNWLKYGIFDRVIDCCLWKTNTSHRHNARRK